MTAYPPELPQGHPPIPPQSPDPQRTGWRDAALWGGAGLVMLIAHGAGAYALRELQPVAQTDGAAPPAIMMELAPEPMAPIAEEAPALVPEEETEEASEEAIEPEPDVVEPVEELQPETPPQEIAQAEPVPEIEQPEMEPVPDVVETEKPEVVAPKPVEKPKVIEKPKQEKPKVVEKAKPKKVEKPKPVKKQAAAPQVDATEGAKVAANRNSETAGSSGAESKRWQAKVFAHLKRYAKRHAPEITGRVFINFSFDSLGNVLSVRASSKDPALDKVVEGIVRRASPIAAPPPAVTGRAFAVPFEFK
ncbi:TonB family protein [Phyllobacterium leguminum]|uniref:Protein TonB n=1 Tax=Phyllobacterium leguminum TaxID=314237 RepID=A0A318TIA0_9HYPH|nr:TonB family protein [Phyllobacterium leguminum]PYE88736.1 protein TonB [Phyllobacterium leguminum]